ncbi:hypothetical protein EAH_00067690 [Eimeria acervulina]|uniref:Uncharacterized protein n=1 Tax=Eimeria acervulina TaxID=5801 RepID=U6GTC9_EIMAC|nr:hypothetical protein EAH_00067690 [Eimeria acervulina]CDI82827.1 hypothetical protein EAH_00067690 [Eimeria acervulina]
MALATGPAAESVTSELTAVVTGPAAESASSGFTDVGAGPSAVSDPCGLTTAVTGPPVGSATSGSTGFVSGLPEDDSSGSASPGEGSTQCTNESSGETVSPVDAQVTSPGGTDMQSGEKLPRPHGTGGTTVLFRHVGQRGSNVAYMVVGSEISDPQESIDTFKPKEVAEKLGFELLMLDAMFAASEVIGAKARRADWWQNVIDKLPVFMGPTESALSRPAAQQNISLIRFLDHALQFYQLGLRPPASLLVPLKQVLLCTSAVPPFTKGPWAKFRNDDTDWHQSQ